MKKVEWQLKWKNLVKKTKYTGVWVVKDGGHLVRGKAYDPANGKRKEIKRVLAEEDPRSAFNWLQDQLESVRNGALQPSAKQIRFEKYVENVLESKCGAKGRIKSQKTRDHWKTVLGHLIHGTNGVQGFGEYYMDQIQYVHVQRWKESIGDLIDKEEFSPVTCNGWLAILRCIFNHAKLDLDLVRSPAAAVTNFDTSTHVTYTEEEPNSLTVKEAGEFLECLREVYPQHYAMTFLGLVTGLRPSSLRPLRRQGAEADIKWDEGKVYVRRSQTRGIPMNKTKTGVRQTISLSEEVMAVLRWHVETQLPFPQQQGSDLLFPSVNGTFRSPSVLNKPFADVAGRIGLGKKFTQRGLRRSYQDLMRFLNVDGFVVRSISGHRTEKMQEHYSTIGGEEQRCATGKFANLVSAGNGSFRPVGAPGGAPGAVRVLPKKKAG
jgi:integrase